MRKENRIDYVEIPVTDPANPGGRRFHFVDPVGNEYAIWAEAQDE